MRLWVQKEMKKQEMNQEQKQVEVCDDCLTFAWDNRQRTREEQEQFCMLLGDDAVDHTCLKKQGDQDRCDCGCNGASLK